MALEDRIAQRAGQLDQDRGARQERDVLRVDVGQVLGPDVVGDEPVVAVEASRLGARAVAEREGRQVEPGRPALGPVIQLGDGACVDVHTCVADDNGCLAVRHGEIVPAELEERPLRAQPGQAQPRRAAPREHERRSGGQVGDEGRHRLDAGSRAEQVDVVQDEHDRTEGGERSRQRAAAPAARQVEGPGEARRQSVRVVVALIECEPRKRTLVPHRPLREQRRLAVARRGHEHDDGRARRGAQPVHERCANDGAAADRGNRQLRVERFDLD